MKIGLSGVQSVGKTTLLNALRSEEFFKNFNVQTEATRWVKQIGLNINEDGNDLTQSLIIMKHIENVFMNDDLLSDRTALDVYCYTLWMARKGKVSQKTLEHVYNAKEKILKEYDYIFYIKPEFEIEDDGVRSIDVSFRDEMLEIFNEMVKKSSHQNIITISGSVAQRITQVMETINETK